MAKFNFSHSFDCDIKCVLWNLNDNSVAKWLDLFELQFSHVESKVQKYLPYKVMGVLGDEINMKFYIPVT